jgi:hypothetical protein
MWGSKGKKGGKPFDGGNRMTWWIVNKASQLFRLADLEAFIRAIGVYLGFKGSYGKGQT